MRAKRARRQRTAGKASKTAATGTGYRIIPLDGVLWFLAPGRKPEGFRLLERKSKRRAGGRR